MTRLILALALLPTAALADWRYDPDPLPSGQAIGAGTGGQRVVVECSNGGLPAVLIEGPRPVGGEEEAYVLRIDRQPERVVFADCTGDLCLLQFDSFADANGLLNGLRSGSSFSIGFYRNGPGGDVSLRGSSAAIGRVLARDCPMG